MLRGIGDEAIEVLHDGGQHCWRRECLVGEQYDHQTRFIVLFGARVFRFGHAISEDDQPVTARERDLSRFVGSILQRRRAEFRPHQGARWLRCGGAGWVGYGRR